MRYKQTPEEYIENKKEEIKESEDLLEENKNLLLKFERFLELNDYSNKRRWMYLNYIKDMGEVIDVPFDEAERGDIENIILWLKRKDDWSEATKKGCRKQLKRFYRWIGDGEYPECIQWVEYKDYSNNQPDPQDLLNEYDIKDLLEEAKHPRNHAFISFIWESGARIGEILAMNVGSVEYRERGMKAKLEGKTGPRTIPLVISAKYLKKWLQVHPSREDKEAPLWVSLSPVNRGERVGYKAIHNLLKRTAEKVGIDKPINPHNFRKSRATFLANGFTEAQLCEWFGWVQGSKVVANYVQMSGRDLDKAYFQHHGLEEKEDGESPLMPEDCPLCEKETVPTDKFCPRCSQPLDFETAWESEKRVGEMDEKILNIVEENPDLLKESEKLKEKVLDIVEENADILEENPNVFKYVK